MMVYFEKTDKYGYGYFSYIENDELVIGETTPHEGGVIYRGEYKGIETPYILEIMKSDKKLFNEIIKYFKDTTIIKDIEQKRWDSITITENDTIKTWFVDLLDRTNKMLLEELSDIEIEAEIKMTEESIVNFHMWGDKHAVIDCEDYITILNNMLNKPDPNIINNIKDKTEKPITDEDIIDVDRITIVKSVDNSIYVISDKGYTVSKFNKITDPKKRLMIALADFLGYEPAHLLDFNGTNEYEFEDDE